MIARLVRLELLREARSRDVLSTLVVVGALVVVVADVALHDLPQRAEVAAATFWMGLSFAASLALGRGTLAESDLGTIDTVLTLPASRAAVYLGAAAANTILLGALAVVLIALNAAVAGDPLAWTDALALPVVLLGVVGLASSGTLLAALAARTRGRALMLPVLLLPLAVPVLVAALHGTADVLHGGGWDDIRSEVTLLAGYDVLFLALAALLFEHAVEG
ncbi:MAG TPA: heme exporter protein CcmB [Candidatus Thermoplasmatota archaeon]|nr:heme exporter protein CcmB [Candidatus Thermoplasmatota archaeon]